MIKINLLPAKAVRRDVKNREFVVITVAALAVVLAGIFFVNSAQQAKIRDRDGRISKLRAEIAALQKQVKEVEEFKKKQENLRRKIGIIEDLRKKKTGPVRVLDDLSINVPDDVWLSSFRETGGRASLVGQGIDDEGISEFLKALQDSAYFGQVELLYIRPGVYNQRRVRKFEIAAQITLKAAS